MGILLALVLAPLVLIIIGIAKLFSSNEHVKKMGSKLILYAILLLGTEILIGYSLCSNIHIGGGH